MLWTGDAMYEKRNLKFILLAVILTALCLFSLHQLHLEHKPPAAVSCLNVPVVSSEDAIGGRKLRQTDYYNQLFFEGERVGLDRNTNTIYLSQKIDAHTTLRDLQGRLELQNRFCSLVFPEDPMFDDLDTAVRDGHVFSLLILQPFSGYSEYQVVFTTLPVIRMDGDYSHTKDDSRKVNLGDFCVWNAGAPDSSDYSTKSTRTYWNIRGGLTTDFDKKSWRLSLVDEKKKKNSVSFFGLDADDDWILNALVMDDTKLRDRFCMNLWNELADDTDHNFRMSDGGYAELVLNGEYAGLYLLQRRIDDKYLQLDTATDILMKGRPDWQAQKTGTAYEVQSSPLSEADSCLEIENAISGQGNCVNLPNFIDLNLMLQFTYAIDNCNAKNMFYVLQPQDGHYLLSWVPWDMDLTFGNRTVGTPAKNHDNAVNAMISRRETTQLAQYIPDLDVRMSVRWQELRSGIYSEENLIQHLQQLQDTLSASGALQRDQVRWGLLHDSGDTPEQMLRFMTERLTFLDNHYSDTLSG